MKKGKIIDGLYADPDIAFFDGKTYIYPTTDGFRDWSGTEFYVFVSEDLETFTRGERLLDLSGKEVPWAVESAWAPCIACRNGKYYFCFCGKRPDGVSAIGVAWSDNPEGPYQADDEPLLTMEMMESHRIKICQVIDPSIFCENGKYWIVFGNGYPVIAQLTEDMRHIIPETMKNIDGAFDFCEAMTILKRGDLYHFTWSCNDTRSEDYHVNYGISRNLYGPVSFQYTILQKCPEKGYLGCGHHSIAEIPGQDRYVIAYHRFGTPLEKYKGMEGYCREICMAELKFGEDGKMLPVEL